MPGRSKHPLLVSRSRAWSQDKVNQEYIAYIYDHDDTDVQLYIILACLENCKYHEQIKRYRGTTHVIVYNFMSLQENFE